MVGVGRKQFFSEIKLQAGCRFEQSTKGRSTTSEKAIQMVSIRRIGPNQMWQQAWHTKKEKSTIRKLIACREINITVLSLSDKKKSHLRAWQANKIKSIYLKLMNLKLQGYSPVGTPFRTPGKGNRFVHFFVVVSNDTIYFFCLLFLKSFY